MLDFRQIFRDVLSETRYAMRKKSKQRKNKTKHPPNKKKTGIYIL